MFASSNIAHFDIHTLHVCYLLWNSTCASAPRSVKHVSCLHFFLLALPSFPALAFRTRAFLFIPTPARILSCKIYWQKNCPASANCRCWGWAESARNKLLESRRANALHEVDLGPTFCGMEFCAARFQNESRNMLSRSSTLRLVLKCEICFDAEKPKDNCSPGEVMKMRSHGLV